MIGLIGSGNMAGALARGWGEAVLCTDAGSGRAQKLAAELGGEALRDNVTLAERADLVILAHKPAQLADVAGQIAGRAAKVVSLLARVSLDDLRRAYPGSQIARLAPNTPVEVRKGVTAVAAESDMLEEIHALFGRVGTVVEVPERLMDVAGAVSGVGPAFWALIAEAWVDAAVRRGLPAELASQLAVGTMAGTAALLADNGGDTLRLRREVASPGGTTARGLAALERNAVRRAFAEAVDDVVEFR